MKFSRPQNQNPAEEMAEARQGKGVSGADGLRDVIFAAFGRFLHFRSGNRLGVDEICLHSAYMEPMPQKHKGLHFCKPLFDMAPRVGLEPTTQGLTVLGFLCF